MRIADKIQYGQVTQNIQKNRQDMADLQNQAATQKRINKPSDDPLAAARVLSARTEERGQGQFIKNVNTAKSFLEFTDNSLGEINEILVRAKELAIAQASDAGANATTRKITAQEISQIYDQAVQVGNRKLGDRYIFSGFNTTTPPFDNEGRYKGDDGDIKIQTHKDTYVAMNISGDKVFLGKGLGQDGTSKARIFTPLTVEDLQTFREDQKVKQQEIELQEQNQIFTRGPASAMRLTHLGDKDPVTESPGVDVFRSLKSLQIALETNDKLAVQDTLEILDQAIAQVVTTRAEVGSRLATLNSTFESLQKSIVDNKALASSLEDADVFQVISDINRTESTLKATLETSPKMIQPSLMDFLR